MRQILKDNRICAIMRNIPIEKTLDYAIAAYRGGIRMFEIAMNSEDAVKQIELMRNHFEEQIYVGAGTVITKERCQAAKAAGAQFFLTPSVSLYTLEFCRSYQIPLLPGVLTPTDVAVCLEYGYPVMKLFPAGDMPPSYIRSLKGPFDETEYVAVGGVNAGNVGTFLKQGFIAVGMGSSLLPKEYIRNNDWDKASEYIKAIVERI
ncbi:bifunctional 4-hydroxy-2-oxoglutarate aldolase/2-dehydro-3-deoxy-phosphogluconate aldolase [Clostridiales bacterium COT073_COT-073]|nr:bifunctional 4-hydroxy-2-oxoglutarate aldolase/2-dehydro-3-deoxy-phosphogluconate aldolase [Clostridiales bacterium COT073_COT-073]